ncbi:MAG: VIT domain-containing protein [Candidatus Promineifilaceae bacterium]|nr:VIT domain-containing protein [Candidatus Promineifilaceae bacterium]
MEKRTLFLPLLVALIIPLLVLLSPQEAGAQEPIRTPEPVGTPIRIDPPMPPPIPPPTWTGEGLRIEYQRVNVTVEGQVATTHIEQSFFNDSDRMLEGNYLYPLPEGAAVSELTMWVDGQPIEARILDAGEARAIYDEIVRQLRDPALLEYVGTDAIQANVFPIPAHDRRRIEIEYSHVLPVDNGLVHYVFPQATDLYTNAPLESQSIRVAIASEAPIRAVYSPSHPVAISREGEQEAVVGYEANDVHPKTDFELFYSVSPEAIGLNLLSYKEASENGFFLMLVAPTIEVDPDDVIARDVILVLDVSGSMEGEKMAQAREAARYVVNHLNPEDRFNIIAFSTGVRTYRPGLTPVAEADDAGEFIDRREALVVTNISLALMEAMNQADPAGDGGARPLTVIFMTDGLATEGIVETPLLLEQVGAAAPENARIFAFGVGYDVDTHLLDSLAQNHGGTTTYVRPEAAIDEAVSSFYNKISTPVLANVDLEVEGVTVEQIYPTTLPDLFAGTQLVLTGRYREGGKATVRLQGEVNGESQTFIYDDVRFQGQGGEAFIPRLWATRAIGHLLRQIRLQGENEELVQSVVDLSIRYGIITPYTSYLIEEEDIFTQSGRDMLVEEEVEEAREAAPVSGAAAVDEAAAEADLAEAEAPAPVAATPVLGADATGDGATVNGRAVQVVGNKTFVYRDGVWIDTAYQADAQRPERIAFAGNAYFELLNAAPELGQYLALGQRVLVVHDGTAYEIVTGEGDPDPVLPASESTTGEVGENEAPDEGSAERRDGATEAESAEPALPALCLAALMVPLFIGAVMTSVQRWSRRR